MSVTAYLDVHREGDARGHQRRADERQHQREDTTRRVPDFCHQCGEAHCHRHLIGDICVTCAVLNGHRPVHRRPAPLTDRAAIRLRDLAEEVRLARLAHGGSVPPALWAQYIAAQRARQETSPSPCEPAGVAHA